ncbi:MAG: hypothetical protein IAX21_06670 [Candidatus Bathyarchaeota archaeon]|nr:hypothetical protein [Candidatus Bathyarchaeum tardum]WGM89372.1 MAG: hypothetical protein NUK63_10785 [Candidatus Bathyarchaeum tardum]WNZ28353.1 MAG: hypothetical protein IAX21_06670 [Candidatus Bathyarchaeota archaeon]
MTSGLLVASKNGLDLQLENLTPIEDFEQLDLFNKYGFKIGWYTFGKAIHVILKQIQMGENQIYLAEKLIEAESILNKLINELVESFDVTSEDQKDMFKMLKEHGCCYF